MLKDETEARLLAAFERCKRLIPEEQLAEMSQLVRMGEPCVALENLCVQLYEYGAPITHDLHRELHRLVEAMELNDRLWRRLTP